MMTFLRLLSLTFTLLILSGNCYEQHEPSEQEVADMYSACEKELFENKSNLIHIQNFFFHFKKPPPSSVLVVYHLHINVVPSSLDPTRGTLINEDLNIIYPLVWTKVSLFKFVHPLSITTSHTSSPQNTLTHICLRSTIILNGTTKHLNQ